MMPDILQIFFLPALEADKATNAVVDNILGKG